MIHKLGEHSHVFNIADIPFVLCRVAYTVNSYPKATQTLRPGHASSTRVHLIKRQETLGTGDRNGLRTRCWVSEGPDIGCASRRSLRIRAQAKRTNYHGPWHQANFKRRPLLGSGSMRQDGLLRVGPGADLVRGNVTTRTFFAS